MNVCLILPYYGHLPKYFPLYLQGLKRMNFTVMLVSDIDSIPSCDNLKILKLTLADVESLARKKLGTEVYISHPTRLCDMKPMYGKIFEDYLKEYDYWGFGDCDLIYGQSLNEIVNKAIENNYDVISLRKHWTTGSFCLVKNNETCTMLYSRAENWKDVVRLKQNTFVDFDETGGKWHRQLEQGEMTIEDCRKHADSFTAVVWRSTELSVYHEDHAWETELKGELVHIHSNGMITVNGVEVPIVHFVNCKGRRYFVIPRLPVSLPKEYRIMDTGFYLNGRQWHCRKIVALYRKLFAIVRSVCSNGLGHWMKRLSK